MKLTKRLNRKINISLVVFLIWQTPSQAQTLQQCHEWATEASTALRQSEIQEKIEDLQNQKLRAALLPTLQLNVSASYQSDVFGLPFSIPGSEAPEIPRDQYNLSLKIQQKIFDGGITKKQQSLLSAESAVKQTELELKKELVKQIINELYFGILQTEAQQALQSSILSELENRMKTAKTGISQGIMLPSGLKHLEKEQLKVIQNQTQLELRNQAQRNSLSEWTQKDLMNAALSPNDTSISLNLSVERKELKLFEQQQSLTRLQADLTGAQLQPKLFAFGNVGLGQPNPFNFFETDWNSFYMVGAKLQWQIWDWGKSKRIKEVLGYRSQSIDLEKEHFLQKIDQKKQLLLSDIQQLESQITTNQQLIKLQGEIVAESSLRLEEGTLSQSDYLTEFNSLNQLKSQAINHQIRLDYQKINYLTLIGQL